MNKRVVVTGIGVMVSNANNKEELCKALVEGICGIKPSKIMQRLNSYTEYCGEIKLDVNLSRVEKFNYIAKKTIEEMFEDANVNKEYIESFGSRGAFTIGTANLPSLPLDDQFEQLSNNNEEIDCSELNYRNSESLYELNSLIGNRGELYFINSACVSGTTSVGIGYDLISSGNVDVVVAAGVDVISDVSVAGFNSMNNMSENLCKPFDKLRTGINLGEASAFLLLESEEVALKRGAKIYGEIFAYNSKNDAYHITSPDPTGTGAYVCMNEIIKKYDFREDSILYINTHGTGTSANDEMELKAMERVLSENENIKNIWFSSSKSLFGHCLGAAGTIELATCLLGMNIGKMPISISVENPMDMSENLKLVTNEKESIPFDVCISNSFAFAGNSGSIGICKYYR
ncbi:beta-ketoacyl-[acyl-carrier-protein] synthase family protein [uncultured Clostridium sp.]|uniref:beta-ketoacyl-[acyl-carrier-protein] synthase family protein n=1 Tax=uncultured Clostridium sp. TaxID=59620 RepID=UPI0025D5DB6A|nr:beta-ketoacyl-[acyl-carrier-protein] synthase family protein [uncultured Clostridium sp.]